MTAPAPSWLLDMLRPTTPAERLTIADVEKAVVDLDPEERKRLNGYTRSVQTGQDDRLAEMQRRMTSNGAPYLGEPWNQTTFDVACTLVELANSPWNDYQLKHAYADLFENAPRDPGFTDETVNTIWASALSRVGPKARPVPEAPRSKTDWVDRLPGQSESVAGPLASTSLPPASGPADPSAPVDPQPEDTTELASWGQVDLTGFLEGRHAPEEPTLLTRTDGKSLLYAGRVHSFHGESESGKSLVALAAAVPLLETGQPVLMVDFESDAPSTVSRLLALGATRADIAAHFDYRRPEVSFRVNLTEQAAWAALLARRYALVIIDGVTEALTIFATSSKDNDEVTHWIRTVPRLIAQRTGGAVVLIDHVTKDADSRGRFAIGGQAKMAALDGAAYLVEVLEPIGIGMRGAIALRVAKDRPGRVRPDAGSWRKTDRTQEASFVVVDASEKGSTVVTFEPARASQAREEGDDRSTWRPTALMAAVSLHLAEHGPSSKVGLEDVIHGRAVYVRQAINALVDIGCVAHDGPTIGGHPTYRLVKPYSIVGVVPDDPPI